MFYFCTRCLNYFKNFQEKDFKNLLMNYESNDYVLRLVKSEDMYSFCIAGSCQELGVHGEQQVSNSDTAFKATPKLVQACSVSDTENTYDGALLTRRGDTSPCGSERQSSQRRVVGRDHYLGTL